MGRMLPPKSERRKVSSTGASPNRIQRPMATTLRKAIAGELSRNINNNTPYSGMTKPRAFKSVTVSLGTLLILLA